MLNIIDPFKINQVYEAHKYLKNKTVNQVYEKIYKNKNKISLLIEYLCVVTVFFFNIVQKFKEKIQKHFSTLYK